MPIDAPQNMFIVSIPTVLDKSLAPEGKHLVHIYTAGNEPYKLWEGMKRGSPEYEVRGPFGEMEMFLENTHLKYGKTTRSGYNQKVFVACGVHESSFPPCGLTLPCKCLALLRRG